MTPDQWITVGTLTVIAAVTLALAYRFRPRPQAPPELARARVKWGDAGPRKPGTQAERVTIAGSDRTMLRRARGAQPAEHVTVRRADLERLHETLRRAEVNEAKYRLALTQAYSHAATLEAELAMRPPADPVEAFLGAVGRADATEIAHHLGWGEYDTFRRLLELVAPTPGGRPGSVIEIPTDGRSLWALRPERKHEVLPEWEDSIEVPARLIETGEHA